jgi:hypothetical protein
MNISGRLLLALATKQPPTSSINQGGGKRRELTVIVGDAIAVRVP